MQILKLKPAIKDYLWGGTKLKEKYNKISNTDIIAETWELSAHKDGQSIITNGEYKNKSFGEYLEKEGNKVIGKNYNKDRFPILIKFIDALNPLSIQVHPKDDYGLKYENDYGKTELWYVLEADEGANLFYGFNKEVSKEEFKNAIEDGTLESLLNKVYVKPGDIFLIESGTVHAIGAGIVVCEIQQNSNVTYRVYDYKRKDKYGNERELHIEKALDVSDLTPSPNYNFDNKNNINKQLKRVAKTNYFDVLKGSTSNEEIFNITNESFHSIIILDGDGNIKINNEEIPFIKGDSFFIPAQNSSYSIIGKADFIISRLPIE